MLLDQRSDLAAGEHLVLAPCLVRVERHELDEADDVRLAPGELGQGRHLLLGEAADRDAVDLDRAQLRIALGLGQPAEHLVQGVAARDLREADVRERVERDIEAGEPGLDERRGEAVEQHTVRRQREVAHARCVRKQLDEHRQVAPDEGLTARQADLVHAHRGEHAHKSLDLLEAENLLAGKPLEPFGGHAVAAPEVALVRDRDPQAADLAIPGVCERLHVQEVTGGLVRLARCR